jgi:hypothetical protein
MGPYSAADEFSPDPLQPLIGTGHGQAQGGIPGRRPIRVTSRRNVGEIDWLWVLFSASRRAGRIAVGLGQTIARRPSSTRRAPTV